MVMGAHIRRLNCTSQYIKQIQVQFTTYECVVIKYLYGDLWGVIGYAIRTAVDLNMLKQQRLVPGRADSLLQPLRRLTLCQETNVGKRICRESNTDENTFFEIIREYAALYPGGINLIIMKDL